VVTRIGALVIVLIFLIGLWLVVAPFALRFQDAHAPWAAATRADVFTGGILAVVAFTGMFGLLAGRVREMYADAACVPVLAGAAEPAHRE
jgi:cytochrome c oxidase assembly factor CtaG